MFDCRVELEATSTDNALHLWLDDITDDIKISSGSTYYGVEATGQTYTEGPDAYTEKTYVFPALSSGVIYEPQYLISGMESLEPNIFINVLETYDHAIEFDNNHFEDITAVASMFPMSDVSNKFITNSSNVGEILKLNNPVFKADAPSEDGIGIRQYAESVVKELNHNITYVIRYRGDPAIDAGDIMLIDTLTEKDIVVRVLSHSLTFKGSIEGELQLRRLS